jgi:hypothetical protein
MIANSAGEMNIMRVEERVTESNAYWPCFIVEHDRRYSICLSSFHFFDDYFGGEECGGYTLERLARKLLKDNDIKGIKLDSEAGMFCAYSESKENLMGLCALFRNIVGDEEDFATEENLPTIPLDEAERLLLQGFVMALDKDRQEKFLRHVPCPSLSKKQSEYLGAIQNGSEQAKIVSAKKINSEARTLTRKWDHYLSHPHTINVFLKAIDQEQNPKVYQELIWALVFICDRHLPDLRTKPYFLRCLDHKIAQIRILGIMGLCNLYEIPTQELSKLKNDKSEKVRKALNDRLEWVHVKKGRKEFPSWMFKMEIDGYFGEVEESRANSR